MNFSIINQIFRFIDARDFINEIKYKYYRYNNFYLYNEYLNHIIANCFLRRIVEKRIILFRSINVSFVTLNIANAKNV